MVVVVAVSLRPRPRRQKEQSQSTSAARKPEDEWMWWVLMAAPSPGRALEALSALSQSNLTTHRLGLALGNEAKASNTMALGLPAGWGGNILCSLINHPKPPKKEKKRSRGEGG